jgi:uncharacterized tellurite resistance protein B-like protein
MNVFEIGPEAAIAALRALRTVARADGKEADLERKMIEVCARLYGHPNVDLDALESIEPAALAAAITDPTDRLRVVQACLLMGLADGEADRNESRTIAAFAKALGVDEKRLSVFAKLAAGARLGARVDFMRHSMFPQMKRALEGAGLAWAIKFLVLRVATSNEDSELAWRYRRLGLLPDGTLGRRYWAHMRENRFAFPGEIGGAPEFAVQHDITHVLSGFSTDPAGEMQIAAFTAGMKREDPFTFCFFPLLQFHAGLQIQPVVAPATGAFDPEKFARAHARGNAMKIDLTSGWDHWPHMERPFEDVAKDLGLVA